MFRDINNSICFPLPFSPTDAIAFIMFYIVYVFD